VSAPIASAPCAVEALYVNHHGWLESWLRRKLGDGHQAADLAQDTFVRVLKKRLADELQDPRSYLVTIARGLVIDLFRRQALEQAWLETLAARPEAVDISLEARAIILETLFAIDRMLDGLDARARQIFLMAQIEGLSYVDIARVLKISVTTVKKHMVRTLTRCLLLMESG
jgi:RNA polymerase sigma-70 factor (ECF subfamily)